MKKYLLILLLILSVNPALAGETFDRVMKSQTIRCGYFLWPPFLSKDVNTGAFSGVYYDIIEEMAKQLSLKVEWSDEVAFDSMLTGFDRYDMICGPLTPAPARARAADFTTDIAYGAYYLYTKEGDMRFDNNFTAIDDPAIKVAVLDGEFGQIVAREDFPKAEQVPVNVLAAANATLMMTLASGKADISIIDAISANDFMKANPGKIRQVRGGPVRLLSISLAIPQDDYRFKRMLDIALQNLHDTGFIERLLKRYNISKDAIVPVASSYKQVK